MSLQIGFSLPEFILHSFDPAWITEYNNNGYMVSDPTVLWALSNTGVKRWSDLPDADVMDKAAAAGMRYGVVFSVDAHQGRSFGTISRSDREFTDEEIAAAIPLVEELHRLTSPESRMIEADRVKLRQYAHGGQSR